MENYIEDKNGDTKAKKSQFDYNSLSGLGESDYENEELFNSEVSDNSDDTDSFNYFKTQTFGESPKKSYDEYLEFPVDYESLYETYGFSKEDDSNSLGYTYAEIEEEPISFIPDNLSFEDDYEFLKKEHLKDKKVEEIVESAEKPENGFVDNFESESVTEIENDDDKKNEVKEDQSIDDLDENQDNILPLEEPVTQTEEYNKETKVKNILSDTSIEDLNKLTEFTEEEIETIDIKSLFDRVGVNVKEASDIFKKNTEMKEKIDSRFEELKKLQSEVEKAKKSQYEEINSYKEEVLAKLTEKKEQIEGRLNKLKEFQSSLEKEKEAFEQYRKTEKEEIERVQKEIQEAYDDRREELNHIEDVLRKQKDALDEERSQLSLDRIQYESDKNELANNLLKFNEIVDAFTNGMDKIKKD